MKILLVGGTGIISSAVSAALLAAGHEVWLITRGRSLHKVPVGARSIIADISRDEPQLQSRLSREYFDCIADFTVQIPAQIDRDYRLFRGRTKQYIFISSACLYAKPLPSYLVTEETPVGNVYWDYARNKQACEQRLRELAGAGGFPFTILRPGHTYDDSWLPLCISGQSGGYAVIKRMLEGKPTIIPGDGSSLWGVTHNSDFARAFLGLAGNPQALGQTIQVASGEVLTWNQIYRTIADTLHVPLHPFYVSSCFLNQAGPYDFRSPLLGERAHSTVLCCDKLKALVPDFQAQVPFHEGIKPALKNLLTNPALQEEDPVFDHWCDRLVTVLTGAAATLKGEFS